MTINQTSSTQDLFQLLEAAQNSQTNATSSATQTSSTTSASAASSDSASTSGAAELFKELEQLSTSNPAEFKKITASISQQLAAASKNSTDPQQAQALSNLATSFSNASQSGKFSDLFPQHNGGSAPPPPPPDSASSAYSSSSSNSSDPLANIFSQALQQIQTDLKTTSSTTTSSS